MNTLTHDDDAERTSNICFKASEAFKLAIDERILDNKKLGHGPTSIQDLCFIAVSRELGIPVPGEQAEEPKRRKSA